MPYRHTARRGRAILLWAAAFFVAVQFGLGLVVDQVWTDVRDPEYAGKLRLFRELRTRDPDAPLIAALGSSRTQLGLQAGRLRPTVDGRRAVVYNFARSACGPTLQLLTLRRLLADRARPDRLLVEVMPPFYNRRPGRLLDEKDLDTSLLRADELARACRYARQPAQLAWGWARSRGLTCYNRRVEMARQLFPGQWGPRPEADPENGWFAPHTEVTPEQRERYTAFALDSYRDAAADFRPDPRPVRALHDLLALCRQNRIPVVLIVPPEGPRFRALYAPAALPVIRAFLADLRRESGTTVIDARDWMAEDDFWDSHHLLPSGARAYTDRLARELETAWAARVGPADGLSPVSFHAIPGVPRRRRPSRRPAPAARREPGRWSPPCRR